MPQRESPTSGRCCCANLALVARRSSGMSVLKGTVTVSVRSPERRRAELAGNQRAGTRLSRSDDTSVAQVTSVCRASGERARFMVRLSDVPMVWGGTGCLYDGGLPTATSIVGVRSAILNVP